MSDMRNIERENKKKQLRSNIVPMPGNRSGSQTGGGTGGEAGNRSGTPSGGRFGGAAGNGQAIWPAGSRIQKNLTATR